MKNLNIALISFHADPAIAISRKEGARKEIYVNGQSIYVGSLGEQLSKYKYSVDMFTRKTSPDQPIIVKHNSYCKTVRIEAGRTGFIHRDELFNELPIFLKNLYIYIKENNSNYDIIHTNYWLSGWIGLKLKKQIKFKHFHTYHSIGTVKYKTEKIKPNIAAERIKTEKKCLEESNCVIATSYDERDTLRNLISQKGLIEIIPCGVDIEKYTSFDTIEIRKKLGLNHDDKVILYVGRIDPRKGITTLFRSVDLLKKEILENLKLIIVADYSIVDSTVRKEYQYLKVLSNNLKLDNVICFTGRVYNKDMPKYYAAADICVIPSHYEPFGLVAIEAMASRTPVIASNVGGLKHSIIHEETGLLFEAKNHKELAAGIKKIIFNSELKNKFAENGRKRAINCFDLKKVSLQIASLYKKAILDDSL